MCAKIRSYFFRHNLRNTTQVCKQLLVKSPKNMARIEQIKGAIQLVGAVWNLYLKKCKRTGMGGEKSE